MTKKFKCSSCETENPSEFFPNRKNLCKKCYNEKQNKANEEKRKLLEKIKAQEQKPEESKPRSPTPSRESYDTFRQAILELNELLMNQKETIEKQTQELQLYKSLTETKFQYLETQIFNLQSENQEIKRNITELEESEHSSETSSVTSENSIPSPIPSPVRPSSPVGINPEKVKIQEIIEGLEENIQNPRSQSIGYSRDDMILLANQYKINRQGETAKIPIAKILLKELKAKLAIC
jgi:hypothetical protein